MRVFVTGASGFVGSAIVKELLQAGHTVLGLARTEHAAEKLTQAGAAVHFGRLEEPESIVSGAIQCDAVIHTAFNHDFTRFQANCEEDRRVILALGEALAGSGRPLVITSGIGLLNNFGRLITETDKPSGPNVSPRAASEAATEGLVAQGVNAYILRLPPTVHGQGDHGFVSMLVGIAKEKKESAYPGNGANRWPAVHRFDAAVLYRLIIEKQPSLRVFHAVAEEGIPFREIATAIGEGLGLPVAGKEGAEAEAHFGWFKHFASMNCAASSELTRQALGWETREAGLLEDLVAGGYLA